jgi:transposase
MEEMTIVGLDIAKQVFQVHGTTSDGRVVVRRSLRRSEVLRFFSKLSRCVVGLEASGGAHHWAREIGALGHDVRLIPPSYVKPYVKRGKTDAIDAEAICEAVSRPTMRFVPVKTIECQASQMALRSRDLLVRQRTQTINALRGHLAELGIVAGKGLAKVDTLITVVLDDADERVPMSARKALSVLVDQLRSLTDRIQELERDIVADVRASQTGRRLTTIPGVGPITAATLQALAPDPAAFSSGRHFAAWIGLTPRSNSSGGKERIGRISKMGNPALRSLLVAGATAVIMHARRGRAMSTWLRRLLERRPPKVVAIALASKMARIAWALLAKGGVFNRDLPAMAVTA